MKRWICSLLFVLAVAPLLKAAEPARRLTAAQRARLDEAEQMNAKSAQLFNQGKAREAITVGKQALAIRRELLGDNHLDTATSLNNLGTSLSAVGDYATARPYLERALAIRRTCLGENDPDGAVRLYGAC